MYDTSYETDLYILAALRKAARVAVTKDGRTGNALVELRSCSVTVTTADVEEVRRTCASSDLALRQSRNERRPSAWHSISQRPRLPHRARNLSLFTPETLSRAASGPADSSDEMSLHPSLPEPPVPF